MTHSSIATSVPGAELSRRGFIAVGGAMAVCLGVKPTLGKAQPTGSLNAGVASSWFEIRADNTLVYRTGKCDFGQSTIYTAYPQIIAEELSLPFEAITEVVSGDTDLTPDGGGTFGLLRTNALNLRKAAAYTREALFDLAAQRLGVPKTQLTVKDGLVSGGGKSVSYGQLVQGQDLKLVIPVKGEAMDFQGLVVDGNPPLKPAASYTVVGKPFKNRIIEPKVTGKLLWAADVKLPGMLHARVIHPATLGSKLVQAGKLDSKTYPTSRVVTVGNLLAVVSPNEWEAIQASTDVASSTKWSEWKELPGHEKIHDHLRTKADWTTFKPTDGNANKGDTTVALTGAAKTLTATYRLPYMKHAPIGPSVAVADVRPDGSVTVHTHSQNPQFLRRQVSLMLGIPADKVVVRSHPGAGHFGRSNGGESGAEGEAVLLSKTVGRPVRVQWMRPEDLQWSTQAPAGYADIRIGLDQAGRIAAYQADHHAPPMQDDRLVGAMLAGLPTIDAPGGPKAFPIHSAQGRMADRWLYDAVLNTQERAHGTWQVGQRESPIAVGLRDHSMRTPTQYQQVFPREVAMTEAAALAGADALQFRIDHTKDSRVRDLLIRLREESGWDSRPSPRPGATASGTQPQRGRGVAIILRENGYWACAAHVAVTPSSGEVRVERVTLVVDPGIVINPLQLRRQAQAGMLMGVSQALHEEVTFDQGAITNGDWASYPILTMGEMPELKVVLVHRPETGVYGQGSETANAAAPPAIAAAVFDATGKPMRRLPLKPDYVKAALTA